MRQGGGRAWRASIQVPPLRRGAVARGGKMLPPRRPTGGVVMNFLLMFVVMAGVQSALWSSTMFLLDDVDDDYEIFP